MNQQYTNFDIFCCFKVYKIKARTIKIFHYCIGTGAAIKIVYRIFHSAPETGEKHNLHRIYLSKTLRMSNCITKLLHHKLHHNNRQSINSRTSQRFYK